MILSPPGYHCNRKTGLSYVLKKDEIFPLGDNPNHSFDSRRMFCENKQFLIDKKDIKINGKIVFAF
jgi:hypothetical protein